MRLGAILSVKYATYEQISSIRKTYQSKKYGFTGYFNDCIFQYPIFITAK